MTSTIVRSEALKKRLARWIFLSALMVGEIVKV